MRNFGFVWVLAGALCAVASARAADADRGKILYETRCTACHKASVHQREARKAASFKGVREQVARWSAEVRSGWSRDEIDDVTLYLNNRYYGFPCPDAVCGSAQAKSIPARLPRRGG